MTTIGTLPSMIRRSLLIVLLSTLGSGLASATPVPTTKPAGVDVVMRGSRENFDALEAGLGSLRVDYDKFKDLTWISTGKKSLKDDQGDLIELDFCYSFSGTSQKSRPQSIYIQAYRSGQDWRWLHMHEYALEIVDAKGAHRLSSTCDTLETRVRDGGVLEMGSFSFNADDSQALVKMEEPSFRIVTSLLSSADSAGAQKFFRRVAIRSGIAGVVRMAVPAKWEDSQAFADCEIKVQAAKAALTTAARANELIATSDPAVRKLDTDLATIDAQRKSATGPERLSLGGRYAAVAKQRKQLIDEKVSSATTTEAAALKDAQQNELTTAKAFDATGVQYKKLPSAYED